MTVDGLQATGNGRPLAFLRRVTSPTVEPAPAAPSATLHRVAVWMVALGAGAAVATILLDALGAALPGFAHTWRDFLGSTAWFLGYGIRVALAVVVLRRRRHNAAAAWFGVVTGLELLGELAGALPDVLAAVGSGPTGIAATTLTEWWLAGLTGIVALQLVARLPSGGIEDRLRRWTNAAWMLVVVPPLAFATNRLVPVPWYAGEPTVTNPLHLDLSEGVVTTISVAQGVVGSLFLVGLAIVVVRYLRSGATTRRQLRWMLGVPVVAIGITVTIQLFPDMPFGVLSVVSAAAVVAVPVFVALTVLGPGGVDVDQVLRRSLVYGVLWLAIATLYVAVGAVVGTAAGRRLPAFGAAVLTVVATLAFQPARQWLERLADRWVFGSRADPAHLVADLGSALQDTYDVNELLPTIESTLRRGLSIEWARVRLDADAEGHGDTDPGDAALRVPIVLGDERLGVVECGPRRTRPLGPEDTAVVETFARQAALAIANVQLTTELTTKATQLIESRDRLVRAQETERRRIERNIHDGVQQELVSLIQHVGEIEHGRAAGSPVADDLADLRDELTQLLTTLRELAAGIHPSLLTDRGLLPAVEALAARHPVPVAVRVDRTLRGRRFAEAVEGAGYFTVAECLANSLKHGAASRVEVTLARRDGSLVIEVVDDGVGLATTRVVGNGTGNGVPDGTGTGLGNLAARLEALDGGLTVESRTGAGTTVRATVSLVGEHGQSS
ncbi:sensor histidine kinase [Salsipaludibacter albus]|uniref:sensor histidine kinase n=1 Tax=Salsipaludibacter albus TaxID=2849650 RepID=UPI001EE468A0|nr:ATP-binding protein [Salsipaludibacter albus]MBY5163573.1 GAF domain-containing protein [Salsipaludibacter albus]